MKIGIIVHSQTGNTLSVAQRLRKALLAAGHEVDLEQISEKNGGALSAGGNMKQRAAPDIRAYDGVVFCAPVLWFSLSSAMKAYLKRLTSLKGKKVGCFVTYSGIAGRHAVNQMKRICRAKGENLIAAGIVSSSQAEGEAMIADMLEKFK